jgi:Raf kinase inhibitor-like YbhB/YbcL family protein
MRLLSLPFVTALTAAAFMLAPVDAHEICLFRDSAGPSPHAAAGRRGAHVEAVMKVTSKVISPGAEFPKRNTCQGEDISPDLAWTDAPPAARSFALILDDPDAPSGTFTHWLLWDIPASTHELPQDLPRTPQLTGGARQGRNGFGKNGYNGPCPPPGTPHRYYFRLFALDTTLGVKAGAARGELERAMEGHVLGSGELMARFAR